VAERYPLTGKYPATRYTLVVCMVGDGGGRI